MREKSQLPLLAVPARTEKLFLLQSESSIYDICCVPVIMSHVQRDCIQIARYRTTVQSSAAWTSSCKKQRQVGSESSAKKHCLNLHAGSWRIAVTSSLSKSRSNQPACPEQVLAAPPYSGFRYDVLTLSAVLSDKEWHLLFMDFLESSLLHFQPKLVLGMHRFA